MSSGPDHQALVAHLRSIPFLAGASAAALAGLTRGAVWREYAAGEVVLMEGQSSPGLYVIHSGWLKIVKSSLDGREQVLRFAGPAETFNDISAFANRLTPATAIALEPAGVWLLQHEVVMGVLRDHPEFARQVIENMADRVLNLVSLVADLSLHPVTVRLARLLLEDAVGDTLRRPRWYTQAELAARLGTVPDVAQRALRDLAAEGIIEVDRRLIRICDRPALEKLAA